MLVQFIFLVLSCTYGDSISDKTFGAMFSSFNVIIRRLCTLLITCNVSAHVALARRACFISVFFSLLMHSEF